MARWGRCDYRELKKLDERLQQLSEVDMDRLCRDAAKKVAQILLNKVKKRTPVGVVPSYATDEAKQEYWAGYSGVPCVMRGRSFPLKNMGISTP